MNAVQELRRTAAVTQAVLAKAGGTSQPTIADYEADRKSPTLDTVRRLARGIGFEATLLYHPPMTREEKRSVMLHRAIADRLVADPERVLEQARRTLARMTERQGGSSQPLREWDVMLGRPLPALVGLLTDPDPWARELRHVTPFAGVLSAAERAVVYKEFAAEERRAS